MKKIQNKDFEVETTVYERFISGAAAGFLSQTAVYPIDVSILVLFVYLDRSL